MAHIIDETRLNDAQVELLQAVGELKFYNLLDENVQNRPNLTSLIIETFAELRKVEVDAIDVE